uniref:alpha/beta hydrolase n=1 Tax=Rhodococcus qingshengii TaxID=334542 RepID=UPI001C4E0C17|nr:alpha/beta hydrolase [Rhodococcus qingshengii]
MILDEDAQEVWDATRAEMRWPLHVLGVAAGRAFSVESEHIGPDLESVVDTIASTPLGTKISVRIYRPISSVSHLPVLLYIHGGGWSIGSVAGTDDLCRELAARADCVVVSVDYRQAPEFPFPAPLDDCWTALRWLVDSSADLRIDPSRVAVGGDSAGGNLAAALALKARDADGPPLVLQLLVYPATESEPTARSRSEHAFAPILTAADVEWFWSLYLPDRQDRVDHLAVPARAQRLDRLPETVVLVADVDPIRDDGLTYARALTDAGVPTTVRTYSGVYHGFFTMVGALAKTNLAIDDASGFLRRAFGTEIEQ